MARSTPTHTPRQQAPQTRQGSQNRSQTSSVSIGDILIGILGQVLSSKVSNGGFVVNDKSSVFQRVNNNWYQVGQLFRSNNSNYPFIISGKGGSQMYVDRRGNIINRAGQVLGLLQALR